LAPIQHQPIERSDVAKNESKAKGGRARAKALPPARRAQIAKTAADARWRQLGTLPKVTHGDPNHPLRIANTEIACYVLETGQRVISQRSLQTGVGMSEAGGAKRLLRILGTFQDKGIDCNDLTSRITAPIVFRDPNGAIAHGYDATALTDLCNAILAARQAGILANNQNHLATQCEILIRSLANVGIIALVDEATGYQEVRPLPARFLLRSPCRAIPRRRTRPATVLERYDPFSS